jgi:hypothetical protein
MFLALAPRLSFYHRFSTMEKWTIVMLVLLSFTGINIMNIGKAMLTPFHLMMGCFIGIGMLVEFKGRFRFSFMLFLFIIYVLFINALRFPDIRYTSVLYTVIYAIEVMILYNFLRKCRPEAVLFAFELIINLYLINLFLGLVLDTLGIKIPAILQLIKVYYSVDGSGGRPMGFSSEPSYAAFILAVLLLGYSHITKHVFNKTTLLIFIKAILCIFFTKSAYGFLFFSVILLDWTIVAYKRGDFLTRNLLPLLFILVISGLGYISSRIENEALQRLIRFSSVAMDDTHSDRKKLEKLQEADGSAFARIAPTYLLFTQTDEIGFNVWMGEGAGAAGTFLANFLEGLLVDEGRDSVDTGIMPALIFDYGYLGFFLFFVFLYAVFRHLPFTFWVLFLLILPNANINTQLIWFAISCFLYVNINLAPRITQSEYEKRRAVTHFAN